MVTGLNYMTWLTLFNLNHGRFHTYTRIYIYVHIYLYFMTTIRLYWLWFLGSNTITGRSIVLPIFAALVELRSDLCHSVIRFTRYYRYTFWYVGTYYYFPFFFLQSSHGQPKQILANGENTIKLYSLWLTD